jgi:sporulation protein YlmC with PRC-barrel domain
MAATKEFQGKLLISATDGKKLGELKDLFLDKDATKISAVYLGKEGLINRRSLLIDIGKVQLFGLDAWLINGSDTVQNKEDVAGSAEYLLASNVRGRTIQTEGGTKIGTVGDVLVNAALQVTGFALDKIAVEGPIAENKAVARAAITELGGEERPMIAHLAQAESLKVE